MSTAAGYPPPAGPEGPRDPARPTVLRRLAAARPGRPDEPGVGLSGLIPNPWLRAAVCLAGLTATLWAAVTAVPPGPAGPGTALLVSVSLAGLGWLTWAAARRGGPLLPTAVAVMGAAGGVVASTDSAGLIFCGVAASAAAVTFELTAATALAAAGPAAFTAAVLAQGTFPGRLLSVAAVTLLGLVSGTGRRQIVQRARQAMLLATATDRAEVARREAELAHERNRLGRELHDVLAHTLGALSIQLTALDTLVSTGASRDKLSAEIEHSHRLVGEGLDEARQAVRALREDAVPLAEQLERLCGQHGAGLEITGTPRPVRAEVSLALYRVVQEALTNAARHAPGAAVSVRLGFEPDVVSLAAANEAPPAATGVRTTGGGYGLEGMRERVLLAGGQCQAGPADGGGWQVTARVPV